MSLSSLDSTRSVLIRYLDVPLIKPYLKEDGLLTDDEYERLQISPQNTSQDAVEKLVRFLKRKGPDHEVRFLSALKRSMNDQEHSGHEYIIQQLTEILTNSESLIVDTSLHELMSNGASAVEGERDSISRKSTSTIRLHNPPMAKKGTQLLRFKVAARTEQIMFSFVSLVLSVYHLLVDNNVPIEEVRIALMYLGCFRDKPFEQNFRMFNSSAGIEHATDHASLITCLHNYSSWFNYKIIKFLGEKFGGAEGLHLIAEYEKRLRTSIETLACYQCPDFSIERGIPPGFEKIDIKVDWDYHSCTASDIAIFERTVSELLGLEPHVWQLQSVDEGCVIMKWAVPGVLVETILCTVMAKREILKREKVIFVMVMGKHVEVSGKMDNKSLHSPIRPRYSLQSTTSIATVSSLSEQLIYPPQMKKLTARDLHKIVHS